MNQTVWMVWLDLWNGGDVLEGVYTSEEKARAFSTESGPIQWAPVDKYGTVWGKSVERYPSDYRLTSVEVQ
jgi:hypothetical protein